MGEDCNTVGATGQRRYCMIAMTLQSSGFEVEWPHTIAFLALDYCSRSQFEPNQVNIWCGIYQSRRRQRRLPWTRLLSPLKHSRQSCVLLKYLSVLERFRSERTVHTLERHAPMAVTEGHIGDTLA